MKTNKIITLIIGLLCSFCFAQAQPSGTDNGASKLALSVYIPDNIDGLTLAAKQNLQNKMAQIISKQGIYVDPSYSRFLITANIVMQDKHVVPTAPI
jgi:hypothetical protein